MNSTCLRKINHAGCFSIPHDEILERSSASVLSREIGFQFLISLLYLPSLRLL